MAKKVQAETEQESRTERAAVTLTRFEKESLRLITLVDKENESTLLRDKTMSEIINRAEELRARLGRLQGDPTEARERVLAGEEKPERGRR